MKTRQSKPIKLPITDEEMLKLALTHRSYANDTKSSNERLEFLGDSVLGLIIAEYLYETFNTWDQGKLSKSKAAIVMEGTLAETALRLGLDKRIRLGIGEDSSGGRKRPSILSDTLEAIIASIYLTRGYKITKKFVLKHFDTVLKQIEAGEFNVEDSKSKLQEFTQALWRVTPTYNTISEVGSPHDKTFTVEAIIAEKTYGKGSGKSKKEAEQAAAREALIRLQKENGK